MKDVLGFIGVMAFLIAGAVGYIGNIIKLVDGNGEIGMLIARGVGVMFPPLGVILGLFF